MIDTVKDINCDRPGKSIRGAIRLEQKYRPLIEHWLARHGDLFVGCLREFCQGNRSALVSIRGYIKDLGTDIFCNGGVLDDELLEDLEYRFFDLIGKFSTTPGSAQLEAAIRDNICGSLTEILAKTKRRWNLNTYKFAQSTEDIRPEDWYLTQTKYECPTPQNNEEPKNPAFARKSARQALDELVTYSKRKFHGQKTRKIAVNWLENPEKDGDIAWFSSLINSSEGTTRVLLTRIKQSLAHNHRLRYSENKFALIRATGRAANADLKTV